MNIKTKQNYQRVKELTGLKNDADIERFINRSVGYFNKIFSNSQVIHKGHIQNYFFILEEMLFEYKKNIPQIEYLNNNKIIMEYGERILRMRFQDNLSFSMISKELKRRYQKNTSRTTIYRFIDINKSQWSSYYG